MVPVYNAAARVGKVVEACLAQEYPSDRLEIVFVDDGSVDDSGTVLRAYPIVVLSRPNGGPARARNAGWQGTKAEIVCFTDDDCLPEPGWVGKLVAQFDDPQVGAAGGSYGIANPEDWLARCVHEEIAARHRRMPPDVTYLGSFNVAYRRSLLEATGGFPERYRRASAEDNHLSYEVHHRGYRLRFDPSARVDHFHPRRLGRYLRSQFRHGYWRMILYRNHPRRLGGDSYAGWLDFAQPPVALLVLVLLAMYRPVGFAPLLAAAALYLLLQLPMALTVALRGSAGDGLRFLGVTMLRGLARGFGMCAGMVTALFWKGAGR